MRPIDGIDSSPRPGKFVAHWPAYAIVWSVGLFCAIVAALWIRDHVFRGAPVDDTAAVILGATLLRVVTIGIALGSVRAWGTRLPPSLVLTGLCGCAAAQLAYPLAELAVKLLLLLGAFDLPATGIGNMSLTGWFNVAMAWLIFGVPGALFLVAAKSWVNRRGGSWRWAGAGMLLGAILLFGIGFVIG